MFRVRLNQQGVALIMALTIMAIATVATVSMASKQQLDIRRTANILDYDQAYLFALSAEEFARHELVKDRTKGKNPEIDSLNEDWATELPPLPFEGGTISGFIKDLNGRFNLNNLILDGKKSEADVLLFRRLLASFDGQEGLDEDLVFAVVDWLDRDEQVSLPRGAEDGTYQSEDIPYRTPNQLMASPSELTLIEGFTMKAYELLAAHVTALPIRTKINVNTATKHVLMSLMEDPTESEAEQILEQQESDEVFLTVDDFLALPIFQGKADIKDHISVSSDFFVIRGSTDFGQGKVELSTMVYRTTNGGKTEVQVVQRSRGAL